jgi:signal peptidase I
VIRERSTNEPDESGVGEGTHSGALRVIREWTDALVIAFLLAMFIRTFVVELFKIPSGSMTPTLVGTAPGEFVVEVDASEPPDGEKDLVLYRPSGMSGSYHVFYRKNGKFVGNEIRDHVRWSTKAKRRARNDRILVNKFIYWFRPPQRGEIVVFRVPPGIYQRDKPIYIKRVVGLPGDIVEIRHPHVLVNNELLSEPDIFLRNEYVNNFGRAWGTGPDYRPDYIEWSVKPQGGYRWEWFDRATVPEKHYLVFGDNSKSSRDSRDWGAVPEANLKGKAVLRYWPADTISFLQ